jgi:hypothetical protein
MGKPAGLSVSGPGGMEKLCGLEGWTVKEWRRVGQKK